MKYDSNSLKTEKINIKSAKELDVKSFNIPKDKYEDRRRVITRRFI